MFNVPGASRRLRVASCFERLFGLFSKFPTADTAPASFPALTGSLMALWGLFVVAAATTMNEYFVLSRASGWRKLTILVRGMGHYSR